MKLLFDSDVLLDVLTAREPFAHNSAIVWALIEAGHAEGLASAVSFSNIFYILRKRLGREIAFRSVQKVQQMFTVAAVDGAIVDEALASQMSDFEDALQAFSGRRAGATHVVTRDATGFTGGPLIVIPPAQLPALLAAR